MSSGPTGLFVYSLQFPHQQFRSQVPGSLDTILLLGTTDFDSLPIALLHYKE